MVGFHDVQQRQLSGGCRNLGHQVGRPVLCGDVRTLKAENGQILRIKRNSFVGAAIGEAELGREATMKPERHRSKLTVDVPQLVSTDFDGSEVTCKLGLPYRRVHEPPACGEPLTSDHSCIVDVEDTSDLKSTRLNSSH